VTGDIVFTRARTDDPLEPPYASPGFIENLGAASILVMAMPLVLPFNVLTCFAVLVASAFSRTKRIRICHYYVAAVVFLAGAPVMIIAGAVSYDPAYQIAGISALVAMIAGLVIAVLLTRRCKMRTAKRDA